MSKKKTDVYNSKTAEVHPKKEIIEEKL